LTKTKMSICSIALLILAVSGIAVSVLAQGNTNPNKLWGAPAYTLNILGKQSDFGGQPAYDPSRHTMFVPESVTDWEAQTGYSNATIWVTQGIDFAVADPNMFDDGHCNLTLAAGKYEVYFVALGKPGSSATLQGWIYNATGNEYLLQLGSVTVSHNKKPDWQSGHSMFYVTPTEAASIGATIPSEMWVFDFLNLLAGQYTGTQYLYLWNLIGGCKHIQVRFYHVG